MKDGIFDCSINHTSMFYLISCSSKEAQIHKTSIFFEEHALAPSTSQPNHHHHDGGRGTIWFLPSCKSCRQTTPPPQAFSSPSPFLSLIKISWPFRVYLLLLFSLPTTASETGAAQGFGQHIPNFPQREEKRREARGGEFRCRNLAFFFLSWEPQVQATRWPAQAFFPSTELVGKPEASPDLLLRFRFSVMLFFPVRLDGSRGSGSWVGACARA